jgi:hypothetical protein
MRIKPLRTKKRHLEAMKLLAVSPIVKDILANIAVEIEGAHYDALRKLCTEILGVLSKVEFQNVSPLYKQEVQKLIKKLKKIKDLK